MAYFKKFGNITSCHLFFRPNAKAAYRQFVATLTQLPPNVKDINLAPLTPYLLPRQTPNSALSSDDANNILNLLRELQCEVANFHKCISALELADQQMTQIESHFGLNSFSKPIEPDLHRSKC
ncbi:hypothetical protein RhiirC2_858843 [Rhizophagus irregularis]|uniref:Uncharacterized protein n=1 Tax=Rhizophagus irregularis TaxID=588596 RepID=A0A2N1M2I4_9GLOM|nr:hypothetical protein RhiirC2_858843 [Rhizophagus irregularis]